MSMVSVVSEVSVVSVLPVAGRTEVPRWLFLESTATGLRLQERSHARPEDFDAASTHDQSERQTRLSLLARTLERPCLGTTLLRRDVRCERPRKDLDPEVDASRRDRTRHFYLRLLSRKSLIACLSNASANSYLLNVKASIRSQHMASCHHPRACPPHRIRPSKVATCFANGCRWAWHPCVKRDYH